MSRPSKHTHVNLHTLQWECEFHGGHTVIVAGLDGMALRAARLLKEAADGHKWPCTLTSIAIPAEEARRVVAGEELDVDDIPF